MINHTVLMSSAEYFSNDQPINPYYADETVDVGKAVYEHEQLLNYIEQSGITVIKVDAPGDSQDGVYTANWALVRGDTAVLARLPKAREAEEAWAERILTDLGKRVVHIPEDWRFSGQGDALPCGNYLLAGQGYRSDPRAQAFAAKTLGYELVQLHAVPQLDNSGEPVINKQSGWPDSFYYDIDLAVSVIRAPSDSSKGIVAYCKEALTSDSISALQRLGSEIELIEVSEVEATSAFACNLVSTGQTVIMSDRAPKFKAELESRGLTVVTPHITELAKGGGFIRCQTLSFND